MKLSSDPERLIKGIARRLSTRDWDEIQRTIEQFGFPEIEWKGRIMGDELVVRTIRSEEDDKLITLATYLEIELESTTLRADSECCENGLFRLFISHMAKHRKFAHDIRRELLSFGISSFVAHDGIRPTEDRISDMVWVVIFSLFPFDSGSIPTD